MLRANSSVVINKPPAKRIDNAHIATLALILLFMYEERIPIACREIYTRPKYGVGILLLA